MATLSGVKSALGIKGEYQDSTLQEFFDEVVSFLVNSGVASSEITDGVVAQGITDLWNYGAGEGKLSPYFMMRATQLHY